MPKISTIMSVYNGERYLEKAVESILTQTFTDFEFIIVNDGSTDNSQIILKRLAEQNKKIHLINQENIGLTKSLNKALAIARGEFIARMDADDIAMPKRFERQVKYLETHPQCLALGCNVLQIDMDGDPISIMGVPLSHHEIESGLLIGQGGDIRHPTVMIRRDALIAVDGYQDKFSSAQDLDLYLRLAERGQLANLPDVLLEYRIHLASVNYAKCRQQSQNVKAILEEAYQRRGLKMPLGILNGHFKQYIPADHHRSWAYEALTAGNLPTARKHALLSIYKAPFSLNSLRFIKNMIGRSIKSSQLFKTS